MAQADARAALKSGNQGRQPTEEQDALLNPSGSEDEADDLIVHKGPAQQSKESGSTTPPHPATHVHFEDPSPPTRPIRPSVQSRWTDEEDYLADGAAGARGRSRSWSETSGRAPLLTGMEAPSVTVASADVGYQPEDLLESARPKSGMRNAFMNMANSIIGAGIIGQPYAFRQAGLLMGIALLVGLTITVDWTIRLIVTNSKLSGADSFQSTVEHCFGHPGLIAISIAQWAFAFGGMLAFCVIIGDTIPHVIKALFPSLPNTPVLWLLCDRRAIIILFVLGISFPLSLYKDIAKLAKASALALVSMLVILIAVITQGVRVPEETKGHFSLPLIFINSGIFQAIGVISFAFVCHHNSLLIYGSLKKPTMDRFARVTHYSTGISMVACLTMALAGFITFGDKTQGNVLNNFPTDNLVVNIARLCFGLNMLTTLPLECFVCREVMTLYFFPSTPHTPSPSSPVIEDIPLHTPTRPRFRLPFPLRHPNKTPPSQWHLLITTSLVLSALLLSLTTCDLGAVFELIGATSACALAYILPPLCYLKMSKKPWQQNLLAVACVGFGTFVLVVSVVLAVVRILKGGKGKAKCD